MFQLLFKYPSPVFTKGHFVLLGSWPAWLLPVLIGAVAGGLGLLIRRNLRGTGPAINRQRAWGVWAAQSALLALLLLLLWHPAMVVGELSSNQNIIAVVLDDSRSMAIADAQGKTRETAALAALKGGLLAGLGKRFQTRVYTLGNSLHRIDGTEGVWPTEASTHLSEGLQQLARDTADLPIGAVLLLSDGDENTMGVGGSGISAEALQGLRNRRLPVHTIGFGSEHPAHDVEIEDVSFAPQAVAKARIAATVSLVQYGYENRQATITVRDGEKVIAAQPLTFGPDGRMQMEPLYLPAGATGAKNLTFTIDPLAGESNLANNSVTRPILVSDARRRVLYVEGEPRWQYKFLRRAEEDDPTVQIVSMLRTSENKIYRQGISDPSELADGFPSRPEDLFGYSGIIIGSVAANWFTPLQQELLHEYVDRRGGGILFLGARRALSDGGWTASSLSELLPTFLPAGEHNFHRAPATVELTEAGVASPVTRLIDDSAKNAVLWRKLTYLADYEDPGTPKPGAVVLAAMHVNRRTLPLLITQNYGRGRTAILASGGTWRWQMGEPLGDPAHDLFWQQLVRWLVAQSPGPVTAAMALRILNDQGRVELTAQVRDRQFQPAPDAHVTAQFTGPGDVTQSIELTPSQDTPGLYSGEWTAERPGTYLAEVDAETADKQALGSDVLTFAREDGIAENFHTGQNRKLLEQLSAETGGSYWKSNALADLPRDISYSNAGISVRSTKPLWNIPIVFVLLLALPLAEWLLRRKWGVV